MPTTSRYRAHPCFRTGTGPRHTRRETSRARLLRALVAHAGTLRVYLRPEAAAGEARRPGRRGRNAVQAALHALVRPHVQVHVTTARAAVPVPKEPETGGWAIVHANHAQTRRSLRRRWFPWTLRAWITTTGDGALALFSWGACAGTTST